MRVQLVWLLICAQGLCAASARADDSRVPRDESGAATTRPSGPPAPSAELIARPRAVAARPRLHPPVRLIDQQGQPVVTSGNPVSAASCGQAGLCHDVRWIEAHSYHHALGGAGRGEAPATGEGRAWDRGSGILSRWDPLVYDIPPDPRDPGQRPELDRWLARHGWRVPGADRLLDGHGRGLGTDCLLCHASRASREARNAAIAAGRAEWASTATLGQTGLVTPAAQGYRYVASAFEADGRVEGHALGIERPSSRACGACHGLVHELPEPLSAAHLSPRARTTELQGVAFSAQRMSDSALNLAGKTHLTRPWDVHAERLLSCPDCHFSPNHPAYAHAGAVPMPSHLRFDARRVEIAEYLERPDHDFARGTTGGSRGSAMRRCETCHDAEPVHRFLPRASRHFQVLACESCHVPSAHLPARQETDWTMLARPGQPRVTYRGLSGALRPLSYLSGYRPVLLPTRQPDGSTRLAPHNLVTTWFWRERGPDGLRPVARETLTRAFFGPDGRHAPALVRALDRDGDGALSTAELVLDSAAKLQAAREQLLAVGALDPRPSGEIQPVALHHGVAPRGFATRACETCHARRSIVAAPFVVAARTPFGVTPAQAPGTRTRLAGELGRDPEGRLVFTPQPAASGVHVLGLSRTSAIDLAGLVLLALVGSGVAGHALLRAASARRRRGRRGARSTTMGGDER